MGSAPRAVVVLTDQVGEDGARLHVATKTLTGLQLFAENWPGELVAVAARRAAAAGEPGDTAATRGELPFAVELVERPERARSVAGAAVVHAFHQWDHAPLVAVAGRRLVWVGEFPVSERIRTAVLGASGVRRARIVAGWLRRGRLLRRMIRSSGGYQANGYPAWQTDARLAPSRMLFFDTRATAEQVAREPMLRARAGLAEPPPLRIAFSGRHVPAKGPRFVLEAVARLREGGLPATLDVFGDGEQRPDLERAAAGLPGVRFHGWADYESAWVPFVCEEVDLFVLPHTQGDPSGTYLEAAASGVPVLGFDNRALTPLVREHGLGWTVRPGSAHLLAERIAELAVDRETLVTSSRRGQSFMAGHLARTEFAARTRHLRQVAQV